MVRRANWSLAGLALSLAAAPALASEIAADSKEEAQIARCIRDAAGERPWLEQTLWGLRDQEAGWIGAAVRNENGTYDLGPLQVNSWWVPRIAALLDHRKEEVRAWLRYNACFNAKAARWIFLSALRQSGGDFWKAVGLYHSPNPWRQQVYRGKVAAKLRTRYGPHVFRGE